ncbi:MAG: hypothetical protein HN929_05345 [Chloroflexi bacterium]|nr:hypothetical protein [Chloroflexota bacterium]
MPVSHATWVTEEEQHMVFPCDDLGIDFDQPYSLLRGISVNASPEILYKWLNQLQYGPYSYDWLDNPGRRSPQYLVEDSPSMKPGKPVIEMFTLASIELNRHFTAVMKPNFSRDLRNAPLLI